MRTWAAWHHWLSACIALLLLSQHCTQAQDPPSSGRHVEYEYTLGGNSPVGGQASRQQQYQPGILDRPGYNCKLKRENCMTEWTMEKKAWCEDVANMPCNGDPFDCTFGFHVCFDVWSDPKKEWCAKNKDVVCGRPTTTTVAATTTTTAAPTTTTTPAPTTTTTLPTTTTPPPTTTTTLPPTTTTTPAATITFTTPAPTTTTTLATTTTMTLPPTITITTLLLTETTTTLLPTTTTTVPPSTTKTTRMPATSTSTRTKSPSIAATMSPTFMTTRTKTAFLPQPTVTTTVTKTTLLAMTTAAATSASTSLSQVPKAHVTSSGAHGSHGGSNDVSLSMKLKNVNSSVILTKQEVKSQVSMAVRVGIAASYGTFFHMGKSKDVSLSMVADNETNAIRVSGTIDPGKVDADKIRKRLNASIRKLQLNTAMKVSQVPDISAGTVKVTDVHIFATAVMHWHCSAPADILAVPNASAPPTGQLRPDADIEVARQAGYFLELANGRGWIAIGKHGQCTRYSHQEESTTVPPSPATQAPTTTVHTTSQAPAKGGNPLSWVRRGNSSAATTTSAPALSSEPEPVHHEPHAGGHETGGHNQGGHDEHVADGVNSSLTVTNVDYARLKENLNIRKQFEDAIREALATVAQVPADAVTELRLSAGSVTVHSIIRPPQGMSREEVVDQLDASTLGDVVLAKLNSLNDLEPLTTGERQVTAIKVSRVHHHLHRSWKHDRRFQRKYTTEEVSVAVLLLVVVLFVLAMFYLVNYRDNDIRLYMWSIISATVCIFTSVLCFSACKGCLKFFLGEAPEGVRLATCFVLVLGIFAALQLTTAVISGTVCEGRGVNLAEEVWVIADSLHSSYGHKILEHQVRHKAGKHGVADIQAQAIFVSKQQTELDLRVRKMKCFASLLTYACGFAAIDAGGALQQIPYFKRSPIWAVMPVVISQVFLVTLFGLFRLVHDFHLPSRGTLMKRDLREGLWERECHESETQIASLSASFLLVQALRFQVSGVMPNADGLEKTELWQTQSIEHVRMLYAWGLGSAAISVVLGLIVHKSSETSTLRCCLHVIQSTTGMIFAWCTIWATRWEALRLPELQQFELQPGSMGYQILLAMTASVFSVLLIFIFDVIEDMCGQEGVMGGLTQSVISALSLLVGFSWQRCFQEAVKDVGQMSPRPVFMELVVSMIVVVLVVPAWQMYILRKEYYYRKISQEKRVAATTKPATIAASESSVDRFDTSTMVSSDYKALGMPMNQAGMRAGRMPDGRGMGGPCTPDVRSVGGDVRSVGSRRGGYIPLDSTDEQGHRVQNGMSPPYAFGQASDY